MQFPGRSIPSNTQTDGQTDKLYPINYIRLGPTARRSRGMSVTPYLCKAFYTFGCPLHIKDTIFRYIYRIVRQKYIVLNILINYSLPH